MKKPEAPKALVWMFALMWVGLIATCTVNTENEGRKDDLQLPAHRRVPDSLSGQKANAELPAGEKANAEKPAGRKIEGSDDDFRTSRN